MPDGQLAPYRVVTAGGIIERIEPLSRRESAAAPRDLLLPGIVDLHGDAFERQIMPRPETRFPIGLALQDTDRQLAANGITTAFHGITCSWEGGLRGRDTALELIEAIKKNGFSVDHRVHLRFEAFSVELVDEVCGWIAGGAVDFLAYNDHLEAMLQDSAKPQRLARFAGRAGMAVDAYRQRMHEVAQRAPEVPAGLRKLSQAAHAHDVATASHDDEDENDCRESHALGCAAAEFPTSRKAAAHARSLGMSTIFGAPNVLLGGSHIGNVGAQDMAGAGLCGVLASDYYYPALPLAPFKIAREGTLPFGDAWRLVSAGPARAAGLRDRGEIRVGQRADLIRIEMDAAAPRVREVYVAGALRLQLG